MPRLDSGGVIVSARLALPDRNHLGLALPLRVARLAEGHRTYLAWHRNEEFR